MIEIRIYTNEDRNEYAIALAGDRAMRNTSYVGIQYPHLLGTYTIEDASELNQISMDARHALALNICEVEGCCEDGAEFVCCNCGNIIEKSESHNESVLYSYDVEIGMIVAYHNNCGV